MYFHLRITEIENEEFPSSMPSILLVSTNAPLIVLCCIISVERALKSIPIASLSTVYQYQESYLNSTSSDLVQYFLILMF